LTPTKGGTNVRSELHIVLEPGDLLIFDNLRNVHGSLGRRPRLVWRMVWLGVTLGLLASCLLYYGAALPNRENAAASFSLWMTIAAFPTSLLVRLASIAVDVLLARFRVSSPGSFADLALEWVIGFATGYIQWFVIIPALRRRLRSARLGRGSSRMARLGIGMLLASLVFFVGWIVWVETRSSVPVDIPVSLSTGREYTREFRVNLEQTYTIAIEVDKKLPFDDLVCLLGVNTPALEPCNKIPPVVKATWVLTSQGNLVAQGSSDESKGGDFMNDKIGREIGSFESVKGHRYKLTVSILSDGIRLAQCNPHLKVEVHPMYNENIAVQGLLVLCGSAAFGLVGLVTLLVSTRKRVCSQTTV